MTPPNNSPTAVQPVFTAASLSEAVENIRREEDLRYAEAVVHICDLHGIEPADIAPLITGSLKDKLAEEARKNRILPQTNTTTLDA